MSQAFTMAVPNHSNLIMTKDRKYKKYEWVLYPHNQAIFWLSTFLLAAYASLFANEIKSFSLPFVQENNGLPNWHTIFFVLSAITAALFFSVSTWVKAKGKTLFSMLCKQVHRVIFGNDIIRLF